MHHYIRSTCNESDAKKKKKKFCLHLDYIMLLYNKTTIYNTPVQFCIKQLSVKKSHNDIWDWQIATEWVLECLWT